MTDLPHRVEAAAVWSERGGMIGILLPQVFEALLEFSKRFHGNGYPFGGFIDVQHFVVRLQLGVGYRGLGPQSLLLNN